jgi:hypothetical protein
MARKAVTLCDRRLFSAGAQGRLIARLPGGFEDLARALTVAYTSYHADDALGRLAWLLGERLTGHSRETFAAGLPVWVHLAEQGARLDCYARGGAWRSWSRKSASTRGACGDPSR